MESENINVIKNINNDNNERQSNDKHFEEEENEMEKSSLDKATSSKITKQTTEENKENTNKDSSVKNSTDIKPILRLVPLEKLLAPKLLTVQGKPTSQFLLHSNSNELKNSSIIILDDSDDDITPNELTNKPIKSNKTELLRNKRNSKYSSDKGNTNDTLFTKIERSTIKDTNEKSRPARSNSRQTKRKTIEKIRQALASSSSEEDDDLSCIEIVESNNQSTKTTNANKIKNKSVIVSDSEDEPLLKQNEIAKNKTDITSSSNDGSVEQIKSVPQKLVDQNHIFTPTLKTISNLSTLIENNNESDADHQSANVLLNQNSENTVLEINNTINGISKNRLLVRLKRLTNSQNNDSQNENYEITIPNKEQLPIEEYRTKKSDNKNEKSTTNKKQTIVESNDGQTNNRTRTSKELRKSDSSDSDENEKSKELENKQNSIESHDDENGLRRKLDSESCNTDKSKNSKNKKIQNKKHELDKSRKSYFDETKKPTKSGEIDCEENYISSECPIIDKINETTGKQQTCTSNTNKPKISEKTLINENIKRKKIQIRLKRLSVTELKNIIKESKKRTNSKGANIKKCVRRRIIHGLASSSSESAVEEEEVIKNNMGKQSSNTERDSISKDNEDDNNNDDDTIKIKVKKPKSTTIMSSSEEDIIQQDEDQSSDNDSNNSSELIRKRSVAVRMKKSTQRSDEEYIINSDDDDDDDDDDNAGNNMSKKNSDNDDDDYESDNKKKIKKKQTTKRKRIKNASDSSDDDDEAGGSNKKRKNIRKLIKTKELNMDTKQAAQEEKDRRKRIEERQRLYNSIYEKPETTELSELILDFDEKTKKTLLKVDSGLLKLLKPHQATGVKFMWDACYETLKDAEESPGSGCILAHCMGLGKTLQVIALTHTLLTHSRKTNVERVLIITPLSTLTNWAREYHHWMKACKHKDIEIYDMSKFKDKTLRTYKLNEWFEEGGVCIMGYDMYRILSNEKTKGLRKKQRETLQQCLVDPGADIVICDEGHLLKNEKTSISKAVTKMRTRRRIVLTGTPLQNNLKEYYCMIQFIKPNLLGTYKEYLNRFVNPITNGQYTDSTERDIRLMKHRSHILHTLLEGCLQRRDYSVLAPYLPPKHEYVIYITLSDVQKILYEFYMTRQRNHIEDMTGKGAKLFQDFQNLRRIWTHPMCLRVNSDIAIKKRLLRDDTESEGSLKDFIDDNSSTASSDSDSGSFNSDKSIESVKNVKRIKTRNQRLNAADDSDIEEVPIVNKEDPSEWWCQMVPKEELSNINHSPKLILLMKVLDECEQIGDKLLLFSQSLQSLDVIEEFLSFINRKTQGIDIECNINGFTGIWQPGVDYFRLDGSSSVEQRDAMCKAFNNINNLRARLFLISTRAGSLGINLVAANRVIIFDVSWNPSHDTQSIFRVYRFGQDKPCYIYRFIAMGTMEQKVYERQVAKQAMAKRVIDEQQIGRHYNQNDLLELYTYELESKIPREIPILPKDRLFADLLANYEKLIYKYHEHDSLLENQESDNLSEEERKAAWDEYESEKNRPPQQQYVMYNRPTYTIGPGGYQAHQGPVTSNKIFGFRTDILLRLLNMKVGRDHPRLTPNEIVQMVPSYLQQLYAEMNHNNPTMYKELLELHQQLEMPQGYYMNPLLYSNQNQMDAANNRSTNPYANRPPPTISAEIVEID